MNDNEKYIEEFMKDIRFDDNPDREHRDLLERQLLETFPKHRLQRTESSVQIWRIIMNNPMTKFAAAAVIIVGVLIGIGVIGNGTGIALAEVMDRIMDISSFTYRLKVNVPDNFQGPIGKPRNIQMRMLVSEEYGMRMDVYDGKSGQNRLAARSYVLLKEQKMVSLLVKQKKYLRYDLSDDMWKEMEKESRNPRAIIEQFVNNPYTELGGDVIDGIEVIGYESRDVSITGEDFGRTTARLWVDIKTKLPVQVEVQGFTKDGEPAMDMVTHEFEWGVDIHPEDFNPVIPSDYEMVGDVNFTGGDEGIAEGLRFFAELTGGRYLSDLSVPTVTRELTEALKAKYGENPMDKLSKEQINRLLKIDFVMGWYRRCASNNMEPAYYGHKVTADNPDAILMRWRGENGRYTVIFGDLRIEDVSAEELMELESAPLNSKPYAIKPQPGDGKTVGTSLEQLQLSWIPGAYVTQHHVYFGTSPDELTLLAEVAEPKVSEVTGLERGNVYYWRVDEVQPDGSIVTGDVWSFSSGRIVGFWKLNEGLGSAALDYSGNERNGKLTNMAQDQWTEDGLYFDGIDDCVLTPALNLYSNTVTITAWLKRDGQQAEHETGLVMCRSDRTGAGLCLGHNFDSVGRWIPNHCLAYNWNNNENAWRWTTDLLLPDNKWVFAALVLEPDRATLYLGEDEVLKSAVNNTRHRMEEFESPITIGDDDHFDPPGMNRHFKGSIGDVRVYDYALSQSEIEDVFKGL